MSRRDSGIQVSSAEDNFTWLTARKGHQGTMLPSCRCRWLPWWFRGKEWPAHAGDIRDAGSVPGSGRSPGVGNSNSLHSSCLGNPMDKRSLVGFTVYAVAESDTTERPGQQREHSEQLRFLVHVLCKLKHTLSERPFAD